MGINFHYLSMMAIKWSGELTVWIICCSCTFIFGKN